MKSKIAQIKNLMDEFNNWLIKVKEELKETKVKKIHQKKSQRDKGWYT